MKRMIRCSLLAACLLLGLFLQVQSAGATGKETEEMTEEVKEDNDEKESSPSVSATGTPGWYTLNGNRYYYNARGKLCTGWVKIKGEYYYFRKKAKGSALAGSMYAGFLKRGTHRFYLSKKNGALMTGWVKVGKKYYYFAEEGAVGTLGRTYTGYQVIDGARYFLAEDGSALTGWQTYNSKKFYCADTGKAGSYGKACTGWKKIDKYWYYFSKSGVLQKNKWIGSYYVNSNGRRLTSTVTPDGWLVDKKGKKTKKASGWVKKSGKYYYYEDGTALTGWQKISGKHYYFDSEGVRQEGLITIGKYTYYLKNGVRQQGWRRIDGYKYYFDSKGRMAVDTTVDGLRISEDGRVRNLSVLIIAGHGQGDVGASSVMKSKTYLEYQYTREFATLIYNRLKNRNSNLKVTMYDQDYDCYQVVAGKKSGPSPDFEKYDYVLEIHFNATVASSKDLKGDGSCKGVSMYVNSNKPNYTLERKILSAIVSTGFKQFWDGVYTSSGLLNAKTCQSRNIPYGLLETAFIDDRDDMKFYQKNKKNMAKAVADAILEYYDLL